MLERATEADISAICALEARPENRGRIGSWSEAHHRAHMAGTGVAYCVARAQGRLAAFAIVERCDDPGGWAYLRRIASDAPGAGAGSALLSAVMDWLFTETATRKFELRVRVGNPAAALYARMGFTAEGVLPNRPDPHSHSTVMTILRGEWEAAR